MTFSKKQKGVLLMFASAFLFSGMQAAVSLANGRISIMEQVFFRNSMSLVLCLFLLRRQGISPFGSWKMQLYLFGRSFFGYIGVIFLFYASSHALQADVSMLNKTSPFFIALLSAVFLQEHIGREKIIALLLAFSGVLISAGPSFRSAPLPLLAALASSLTSAVAYTLLSYLRGKVNALAIIVHFSAFSMAASLPFFVRTVQPHGAWEVFLLFVIALCGSFGQIALTYAYRMAPAGEISVYNYSGLIFSLLLGWSVLGESVSVRNLMGCALVIAASVLVYRTREPAAP